MDQVKSSSDQFVALSETDFSPSSVTHSSDLSVGVFTPSPRFDLASTSVSSVDFSDSDSAGSPGQSKDQLDLEAITDVVARIRLKRKPKLSIEIPSATVSGAVEEEDLACIAAAVPVKPKKKMQLSIEIPSAIVSDPVEEVDPTFITAAPVKPKRKMQLAIEIPPSTISGTVEEEDDIFQTSAASKPKKKLGLIIETSEIEEAQVEDTGPYSPNIQFCAPGKTVVPLSTLKIFQKAAHAVQMDEQNPFTQAVIPTSNSGVNQSYFIQTAKEKKLVVFKPQNGEYGFQQAGSNRFQAVRLKDGIESGGSCPRECIAYYLGGSAGVPPTAEMTLRSFNGFHAHERLQGSAQMFVQGDSVQRKTRKKRVPSRIKRLDEAMFRNNLKRISPEDFHRLFLFDLRTVNTDRHPGNLFVTPDHRLALIDNGCILAGFADNLHYCWMDWAEFIPALHKPFDQRMIDELDWKRDAEVILQKYPNFPEKGIETLRISEFVLKEAAKNGLTPYEIGHLFEQALNETTFIFSPMNRLYKELEESVPPADFLSALEARISLAVQRFSKIKAAMEAELQPAEKLDYNEIWLEALKAVR